MRYERRARQTKGEALFQVKGAVPTQVEAAEKEVQALQASNSSFSTTRDELLESSCVQHEESDRKLPTVAAEKEEEHIDFLAEIEELYSWHEEGEHQPREASS